MTLSQSIKSVQHTTISVAVPVPLNRCFDYLIENTEKIPHPGQRVLVPFAGRNLIGIVILVDTHLSKKEHSSEQKTIKLKKILKVFDAETSFSKTQLLLLQWASAYYCHPIGDCLQTALPTALRRHSHKSENIQQLTVTKWLRTKKIFEGRKNATKQRAILATIAQQVSGVWQETLKSMGHSTSQLKALEAAGYIKSEIFDPLSATAEDIASSERQIITLNPEQKSAVEHLSKQANSFKVSLLQGITGSGKTEVYIERVRQTIKAGKQALILIPEINLTPQTLSRFQAQLGIPIGLVHSGMSSKEKLSAWHLAKLGSAKVIIGTRSAVFTPFQSLGLIIIDEEHDASYKQIDGFKYSARDLAVKRAQIEDCPIILGSATPSLESIYNAQQKRYQHIKLNLRAGAGQKPDMYLIDIRSRPLQNGCSRPLLQRIGLEISQGNQVIIFQNRRGFSPTLMCDGCGWLAQCKHCDARLTVHNAPPLLHCHHCNFKQAIPQHCESCGSPYFSALGAGTERIELGLKEYFPKTKVIRIDRDSIRKQADMKRLIEEINQGEPCLLVGTQMLAKGHDFHNVTLVAIIDADASFFSADFRAIERSAQQLLQVAGRTGRGSKAGTVLIQTRQPDHPLFTPILASDYDGIAQMELEDRQLCELPPYSKMVTIRAESTIKEEAFAMLQRLKEQNFKPFFDNPRVQVSGPIEASIARKSGIYRSFLHIFVNDPKIRSQILSSLPEQLKRHQKGKTKLSVDVDPLDYI